MKLKAVYRKVSDYIRYDLKEIVLPSSLPDPPHIKKRRKITWHERFLVLKEGSRLYAVSWVRDIGPELRPNDYKKNGDVEAKKKVKETKTEPSVLEDLAVAARGGMETLRPALHRLYMTRASAYRDALKSFVEGYQQGLKQADEKSSDNGVDSELNEIYRFEVLRSELIELEKRVQKSTDQSVNEEERISEDLPKSSISLKGDQLVQNPKKENVIAKSLDKLTETTTVTAVGHAAMLAAIQRYVPGLIPSTYGSEGLNLLRQLEKVKAMQTNETDLKTASTKKNHN